MAKKKVDPKTVDPKTRLDDLTRLWGDALQQIGKPPEQGGGLVIIAKNGLPCQSPAFKSLMSLNVQIRRLQADLAGKDEEDDIEQLIRYAGRLADGA